jgi:hypothetical protein
VQQYEIVFTILSRQLWFFSGASHEHHPHAGAILKMCRIISGPVIVGIDKSLRTNPMSARCSEKRFSPSRPQVASNILWPAF